MLLDRQIIDCDGRMAGNVDDLELTFPEAGDGPPYVSAILAGPGALARRFGGRLGDAIASIHARLHEAEDPSPARIAFGVVKRINNHVEVSVPRGELDVSRFEKWTREKLIARIPGAHRANR
jgi:hypothetical protein